MRYCFDKVFGNHHHYTFFAVPDEALNVRPDEIQSWKNLIKQLVEECYPLLFSKIENGNIDAILSVIESPKRMEFKSKLKMLLHLDDSTDVVIASEEELRM